MTWNIQYGVPADGAEDPDLERVASVVQEERPDLLVLDEVHADDELPGGHGDQPAELAASLADAGYRYMYYAPAETIPADGDPLEGPGCGVHESLPQEGTQGDGAETMSAARGGRAYTCGQMVLSKFPIYDDPGDPRRPQVIQLPTENVNPGGRARRALLTVTVRTPGVGDVRVLAPHLSSPASEEHVEDQKEQVRTVLEHVNADRPSVLAGDLNMRPSDAPGVPTANSLLRMWIADAGLVDTWTVVNDSSEGVTVTNSHGRPDGDHPDRRIDYIYASPHFTPQNGHVSLVDPQASDHLAVVMDMQLRQPPLDRHASVTPGTDSYSGWSHAAMDRAGRIGLTVCDNTGPDQSEATTVRASLHRPHSDEPIVTVEDTGTSRDRCTSERFHIGHRPPIATTLRACALRDGQVLACRDETLT